MNIDGLSWIQSAYEPIRSERLPVSAAKKEKENYDIWGSAELETLTSSVAIKGKEQEAKKLSREKFDNIVDVALERAPEIMMRIDKAWSATFKSILASRPDLAKADFDFVVDKKTPGEKGEIKVIGETLSEADRQWLEQKINANKELVEGVNDYTDALMSTYEKYRDLGRLMENEGSVAKAERIYDQALESMANIPFREMLESVHNFQMETFGYLYGQGDGPRRPDKTFVSSNLSYQIMYRPAQPLSNKYINAETVLGFTDPNKNWLSVSGGPSAFWSNDK